jgi:hypothetical protein
MDVANTLAYYNMAIKSFIGEAPGLLRGVEYKTGENLKVFLAKFSTLS